MSWLKKIVYIYLKKKLYTKLIYFDYSNKNVHKNLRSINIRVMLHP